jgi:hypothetical protein
MIQKKKSVGIGESESERENQCPSVEVSVGIIWPAGVTKKVKTLPVTEVVTKNNREIDCGTIGQ